MSLKKYLCAAVSASVLCTSVPAMAQNLPGSADPSRVENQIQEPQFSDDIQPDIRIPELRIEGAPDGADQIKFTLKSIDF